MWPDHIIEKPKSVNVLGVTIPVIYVNELLSDGKNSGEFHTVPFEIMIYDDENWAYTLLHEIIHAAIEISGYNQFIRPKIEESICRILELTMRSVIENLNT